MVLAFLIQVSVVGLVVQDRAFVVTVWVPRRNCHPLAIRVTAKILFARAGSQRVLFVLNDAPLR